MMNKVKTIIAAMTMALGVIFTTNAQNLVIKNTNIIDVKKGIVKRNMDVDIRNGLISNISRHKKSRKDDTKIRTIDGTAKYLMPGYIDTHVHMAMGKVDVALVDGQPVVGMQLEDDLPEITANLLLKHGITTSRDPGGVTDVTVQTKKRIAAGEMAGPEMFVAGSILDTTQFTNLVATVKTKNEVVEEIRRQKEAGVDFIKFYNSLSPELIQTGISEAQKLNLGTIAHLHTTSWTKASRLGMNNIVHIIPGSEDYLPDENKASYHQYELMGSKAFYKWFEYVDLESEAVANMIKTLKANKTSIDPTLVVFHATFFGNSDAYKSNELLNELPPGMVNNWKASIDFNLGWTEQDFNQAQEVWPKVQKFVRMLHENKILLTTGTDANNPWVVPGDSYHKELRLLFECGLTNAEVLEMATLNGAKLLKIEDRTGTVEKGKEADLVILNTNPLVDIKNSSDIFMSISNGVEIE